MSLKRSVQRADGPMLGGHLQWCIEAAGHLCAPPLEVIWPVASAAIGSACAASAAASGVGEALAGTRVATGSVIRAGVPVGVLRIACTHHSWSAWTISGVCKPGPEQACASLHLLPEPNQGLAAHAGASLTRQQGAGRGALPPWVPGWWWRWCWPSAHHVPLDVGAARQMELDAAAQSVMHRAQPVTRLWTCTSLTSTWRRCLPEAACFELRRCAGKRTGRQQAGNLRRPSLLQLRQPQRRGGVRGALCLQHHASHAMAAGACERPEQLQAPALATPSKAIWWAGGIAE